MCFIVFALSPCIVKGSISEVVSVEYTKPLNKTKTTVQTTSCQASQEDNLITVATVKVEISQDVDFTPAPSLSEFLTQDSEIIDGPSFLTSGNSPPKYILFKRLKIALA